MDVVEGLSEAADREGGAEGQRGKPAGSDPAEKAAGHGVLLLHDPPSYFAENKNESSDVRR